MHKEFADVIQLVSEKQGEVAPEQIMEEFEKSYIDMKEPHILEDVSLRTLRNKRMDALMLRFTIQIMSGKSFDAIGNGPIDAVIKGLH